MKDSLPTRVQRMNCWCRCVCQRVRVDGGESDQVGDLGFAGEQLAKPVDHVEYGRLAGAVGSEE